MQKQRRNSVSTSSNKKRLGNRSLFCYYISMLKILKTSDYIKDDPIRPTLSYAWRKSVGEIYYLGEHSPKAVCCVAKTHKIPVDTRDIALYKTGDFGIPYTIWSYEKGAGRELIYALRDFAISLGWERLVTLSPKTKMAHNFHISNGAFLLNENETSNNYEYKLLKAV